MGRSVRREPLLDPSPILAALHRHAVRFVVVGGLAGNLHGSTTLTSDLDLVYARGSDDLDQLSDALIELEARLRGAPAHLPFHPDARTLKAGLNFTFVTKHGPLDCLGDASGYTYDVLAPNAEWAELGAYRVQIAALDDLIRMKRAAGRLKDLIEVENLGKLRDVREEQGIFGLAEPGSGLKRRAKVARRPRATAPKRRR